VKTVYMSRDFPYCPSPRVTLQYRAGVTYRRVPEAAVAAIKASGAGSVIKTDGQDKISSMSSDEISKLIP
jgi:hypothetical protein